MSSNVFYSHSTTPISEGWLIKALCLVYSKKNDHKEKLRKFYKYACENESQVVQITANEALKESRTMMESSDSDIISSRVSRPLPVGTELHSNSNLSSSVDSGTSNTNVVLSSISGQVSSNLVPTSVMTASITTAGTSTALVVPSGTSSIGNSDNNSIISVSINDSVATNSNLNLSTDSNRINKRNKLGFFNMFDKASSNLVNLTTNQKQTTPRITTNTDSILINTTESSDLNDVNVVQNNTSCITISPVSSIINTNAVNNDSTPITDLTNLNSLNESGNLTNIYPINNLYDNVEKMSNFHKNDTNSDTYLIANLVADLVCHNCNRLTQPIQLESDNKTMNTNILVECIKCGSLYHQLCHQPPILMSNLLLLKQQSQQLQWICTKCQTKTNDHIPEHSTSSLNNTNTTTTTTTTTTNNNNNNNNSNINNTTSNTTPATPTISNNVGARKRKIGLSITHSVVSRKMKEESQ